MMMTATVESPPAAAALGFAGNLHLLADVAIAQDEAEKAAALDREILSLRRVASAKLTREKRVLDKFMGDIKKKDFLKLAASVMPWTPLSAAGHKRKRETSYSPEPIIINREEEEEEEEEKQGEKKKKKLILKIKTPSSANNDNNNSPKQSPKQRVDNILVHHQGPATGMPERFKNKIRELAGPDAIIGEEKLLIEKALTESDTSLHQARLTMPERSMHMAEREFLTEEEKRLVRQKAATGNQLEGIDATLVDPLLRRGWGVKLKRWVMRKGEGKRSSVLYAVNGKWKDVLEGMGWVGKKGEGIVVVVRVWSVRVNGRLWLAVVQV
ncbi:unnamed protein product [Cuscuta campestris]|uniref:Uncharacterized protein n=1 Tax=Cuscuta campestris TaxID=132261 RepID=A0A484MV04_9ASTE|nr:unnamed protein product [Cuscuta campestris]